MASSTDRVHITLIHCISSLNTTSAWSLSLLNLFLDWGTVYKVWETQQFLLRRFCFFLLKGIFVSCVLSRIPAKTLDASLASLAIMVVFSAHLGTRCWSQCDPFALGSRLWIASISLVTFASSCNHDSVYNILLYTEFYMTSDRTQLFQTHLSQKMSVRLSWPWVWKYCELLSEKARKVRCKKI